MEHPRLHLARVDSTNAYAKRCYHELANGTVIVAASQSAGRGRLGRSWLGDQDSLMFSLLLKGEGLPENPAKLSLAAAAALCLAIEELGLAPAIKWPNDLLLGEKKVAGILLEGVAYEKTQALILGIGVNVNNPSFDASIAGKATSLLLQKGKPIDKGELLERFLRRFDSLKDEEREYMALVKSRSYLDGKLIRLSYYGEGIVAKAIAITEDGSLLLEQDGRRFRVTSGEATLEKTYAEPV